MNGSYIEENNLTEVMEKTTMILSQLESGLNVSIEVIDPNAWAPLIQLLTQIMNETNVQR